MRHYRSRSGGPGSLPHVRLFPRDLRETVRDSAGSRGDRGPQGQTAGYSRFVLARV